MEKIDSLLNYHTELYKWRSSELHALLGLEQLKIFKKLLRQEIQ